MGHGTVRADGSRRGAVAHAAFAVLAMLVLGGCGSYVIEYRDRPSYYQTAALGGTEDRVTLDDGTVLVFRTRQPTSNMRRSAGDGADRFQVREELDDGSIVLRALLPEHVLTITLTCVRNEEYEILWEQMVAEPTKRAYGLRGEGYEEFALFFSVNRLEIAATLTRMLLGLSRQEAYMESAAGGVIRYRFHPRVGAQFKFKTVEVVAEVGGMKLLIIR